MGLECFRVESIEVGYGRGTYQEESRIRNSQSISKCSIDEGEVGQGVG